MVFPDMLKAPPSPWGDTAWWNKGWSKSKTGAMSKTHQNTGFQHDHSSYIFTIYRRFDQFWSVILGNSSGNTQTWWTDNNTKLQRFGFESLTRKQPHKNWMAELHMPTHLLPTITWHPTSFPPFRPPAANANCAWSMSFRSCKVLSHCCDISQLFTSISRTNPAVTGQFQRLQGAFHHCSYDALPVVLYTKRLTQGI